MNQNSNKNISSTLLDVNPQFSHASVGYRSTQTTFKVKVLQRAFRRSCSWQNSLISQGGCCPRAVLPETGDRVLSFKSVHLKGMWQPPQMTMLAGASVCVLAEDNRVHLDKPHDGRNKNSCLSPVLGPNSVSLSLCNFSICYRRSHVLCF